MNQNGIASSDRLSFTVVFALLCHAVIVFGVTFDYGDPTEVQSLPSLDVILVQQRNEEAPEEADYLAQVAQVGGGSEFEKVRPQAPLSGVVPKPERGIVPQPAQPSQPKPSPETPAEVLTRQRAQTKIVQETAKPETPEIDLSVRTLMRHAAETARIEAEIERTHQAYARRPRRKFISANTKEYVYANYMQAWVAKVERIGNINYPDEARRRDLRGNLVLTVKINRDGNLDGIEIIQPSGYPILDQAAIRIVKLGSPYAPLPENIRDNVDILHITRTWEFLPGNILRHR